VANLMLTVRWQGARKVAHRLDQVYIKVAVRLDGGLGMFFARTLCLVRSSGNRECNR